MHLPRALMALAVLFATASPVRAELLDGTVAAIDYNAISLSVLKAYQAAFMPEQPAGVALQALINDALLAREANRYGQTIANDEVRKAAAAQPIPGTLTALEWQQLLAIHLLAKRFLDFRFGDFVPVSRDELKAYYDAHRAQFPGPFEGVEDAIRQLLVPAVRARRVVAYENELRSRYSVRVNAELLPRE